MLFLNIKFAQAVWICLHQKHTIVVFIVTNFKIFFWGGGGLYCTYWVSVNILILWFLKGHLISFFQRLPVDDI